MKRILFLALLLMLATTPAFGQITAIAANPLGGQITASASNCQTANACVWMKLPLNTGTIGVTVSGTFSATLQVEESNDGGTTFIAVHTVTGALTAATYSASGMTDVRVRASSYSSGTANVNVTASQAGGSAAQPNAPGSTDPCQNSSILKSSVAINIVSATTTQLIAPVATKAVYICGGSFTIAPSATAADTIVFNSGTGATCAVSTVTNTGLFGAGDLTSAAPVVPVTLFSNGTVFSSAVSSGVCAITAGTAVSVQGILSYVQQ